MESSSVNILLFVKVWQKLREAKIITTVLTVAAKALQPKPEGIQVVE